jgi:hypothetical protein
LNERKPILNTFILANTTIDHTVVPGLATLIYRNPLKHLELKYLLKEKPKLLPLEDIFSALAGKETITKVIFKEPFLKLSGQVLKAANKFTKSLKHLDLLELECESYDDIFE